MHQGRSVFSQVMDFFPEREFQSIIGAVRGQQVGPVVHVSEPFQYS